MALGPGAIPGIPTSELSAEKAHTMRDASGPWLSLKRLVRTSSAPRVTQMKRLDKGRHRSALVA